MAKKQANAETVLAACQTAIDEMFEVYDSIGNIPAGDLARRWEAVRLAEGCGKLIEARASLMRAIGTL